MHGISSQAGFSLPRPQHHHRLADRKLESHENHARQSAGAIGASHLGNHRDVTSAGAREAACGSIALKLAEGIDPARK